MVLKVDIAWHSESLSNHFGLSKIQQYCQPWTFDFIEWGRETLPHPSQLIFRSETSGDCFRKTQQQSNVTWTTWRAKRWKLTCKLCTICCFYLLSQQVCWPQTWSICYAFFSLRVTCQAVNILLMKPCEYFQRISPDVQFFPVEAVCRSCVILFDPKCMLFWTVVSSRRNHGVFPRFLGSQCFFGKHRRDLHWFHWQGQFLPDAARCKQLSIEPHGQAGRRTDQERASWRIWCLDISWHFKQADSTIV